ncbi:expressed unknown protein [Seminavis robusta]|uniref:Uncharacterized protein n=1 Tax=Seminavis robusta TaxID=568900 RepID=A0A9N8DBD6_9STRA|nr:expressed unknown protein [Seminavis robusta]|eukprot:Sro43_g026170.1 n/a (508) ;mRNA; r:72031-73644
MNLFDFATAGKAVLDKANGAFEAVPAAKTVGEDAAVSSASFSVDVAVDPSLGQNCADEDASAATTAGDGAAAFAVDGADEELALADVSSLRAVAHGDNEDDFNEDVDGNKPNEKVPSDSQPDAKDGIEDNTEPVAAGLLSGTVLLSGNGLLSGTGNRFTAVVLMGNTQAERIGACYTINLSEQPTGICHNLCFNPVTHGLCGALDNRGNQIRFVPVGFRLRSTFPDGIVQEQTLLFDTFSSQPRTYLGRSAIGPWTTTTSHADYVSALGFVIQPVELGRHARLVVANTNSRVLPIIEACLFRDFDNQEEAVYYAFNADGKLVKQRAPTIADTIELIETKFLGDRKIYFSGKLDEESDKYGPVRLDWKPRRGPPTTQQPDVSAPRTGTEIAVVTNSTVHGSDPPLPSNVSTTGIYWHTPCGCPKGQPCNCRGEWESFTRVVEEDQARRAVLSAAQRKKQRRQDSQKSFKDCSLCCILVGIIALVIWFSGRSEGVNGLSSGTGMTHLNP